MAEPAQSRTSAKPVLTTAQRRALKRRQTALFMPEAVTGHGATVAALRRRGLVAGRQPHAELTPLGERVCRVLEKHRENIDV